MPNVKTYLQNGNRLFDSRARNISFRNGFHLSFFFSKSSSQNPKMRCRLFVKSTISGLILLFRHKISFPKHIYVNDWPFPSRTSLNKSRREEKSRNTHRQTKKDECTMLDHFDCISIGTGFSARFIYIYMFVCSFASFVCLFAVRWLIFFFFSFTFCDFPFLSLSVLHLQCQFHILIVIYRFARI